MSTLQAREWFRLAITECLRRPLFWWPLALLECLLIWSLASLPIYATFLVGIVITWLRARTVAEIWVTRSRVLAIVGVLDAPVVGLWIILWTFQRQVATEQVFAGAWCLPIFFFIALWQIALTLTCKEILFGLSVDRALATAWRRLTAQWRPVGLCAILLAILFWLSFVTLGAGFAIVAPLELALAVVIDGQTRPQVEC